VAARGGEQYRDSEDYHPDGLSIRALSSWGTRHNTVLTIGAASIAPALYLLFIYHYATNSFNDDDWSIAPMIHAALHGQLTLGLLWSQHTESRYFVGNVIEVLFGIVDRFDLRSVIFLSAVIFIVTYAGLLVLVRQYQAKRLTPIPALVIGAIWFSLADVQNALWAAQLSVFLTVFFLTTMLMALLMPHGRRKLWFALGVLCAVAASLSSLQGFVCWPVGAICLLWGQPWRAGGVRREIGLWLIFMVLTIASYLPGYKFGEGNLCVSRAQCTYGVGSILAHPGTALAFFFTLVGYVVPGRIYSPVHDVIGFEALGAVLFGVALLILVRSWRERHTRERLPLPLLLIVFSLLVDVVITVGRSGEGTSEVFKNRYVIYNLIFLTGILVYGLARLPTHLPLLAANRRVHIKYVSLFVLSTFLVVQVAITTGSGLTNGRVIRQAQNEEAEVLVQPLGTLMKQKGRLCQLVIVVHFETESPANVGVASADQLGEFQPDSVRYYRQLGPPPVPPQCRKSGADTASEVRVPSSTR
jgi:hypothetical protein